MSINILAQEQTEYWDFNNAPVKNVIEEIEQKYNVRFSYTSSTLSNYSISYKGNLSLDDLLKFIESEFPLNFNKLDNQNYIITKRTDLVSICGNILDSSNRESLSEVNVYDLNSNKGTTTNNTGFFELENVSLNDTIVIQSLGFEEKRLSVASFSNSECEEILLVQQIMLLDAIFLKEYLTTGFNKNQNNGSLAITPKKLGVLPGLTEPDVLQSLQLIPGISSPNETASGLFVRGGTPDQNLVLWDGIKMYHQGHFFGQISAFNPYITENIEVYRSGTSTLYGDRISSVINISSPNQAPKNLSGGAGFNFTSADAYIEVPLGNNWGLITSARRSFSDILETITFNKLSEKVFQNTKIVETGVEDDDFEIFLNNFQFTDFSTKLIYNDNQRQKFSISTLFLDNTLDFAARNDLIFTSDNLDVSNNGLSVQWENKVSEKWTFGVNGYYSSYKSNFSLSESEQGSNTQIRKDNEVADLGFTLQSIFQINEKHSLLNGYEFSNNQVSYLIEEIEDNETEVNQNADDKLVSHSIFTEYTYTNGPWMLRGGVRINYLSNNETIYFEPRVFTKLKIDDYFSVKASGEIKNQSVSQLIDFEFNEIGVGENIWVLADEEDIPVLNNRQITLGMIFEKSGWSIDIEGYFKKIKGLSTLSRGFESVAISETDFFPNVNSDILGVDILIKKRFKNFRAWTSYTFNKTQYIFEDIGESFSGSFDQPHNLTFANTYNIGNLQCSLGWTFSSGLPFSEPSGIETIIEEDDTEYLLQYSNFNNQRLSNYHRLDASIFYDYLLGKKQQTKIRLGVSLLNIYNQRNEIEKTFRIDENEDTEEEPLIVERIRFGQGFTPNVVCRIFF